MHGDVFQALIDTFGQATTNRERARYGRVARELLDAEVNITEIPARTAVLRARWRGRADVTPEALVKHWSSAAPTQPEPVKRYGRRKIQL